MAGDIVLVLAFRDDLNDCYQLKDVTAEVLYRNHNYTEAVIKLNSVSETRGVLSADHCLVYDPNQLYFTLGMLVTVGTDGGGRVRISYKKQLGSRVRDGALDVFRYGKDPFWTMFLLKYSAENG